MILRVTKYGEPILRTKGEPITSFSKDLEAFAQDMIETMHANNGVGLAAQQVDRALQICIVDLSLAYPTQEHIDFEYTYDGRTPPLQLIMPLVIVNPHLQFVSKDKDIAPEGCLSFPSLEGDIKRHSSIRLEFQDIQGNPHQLDCNRFFARVIQHEFDHLQGVLYIDRMGKKDLKRLDPELKKMKQLAQDKLQESDHLNPEPS